MSQGADRRKYTKEFKLEAVQLCRQPGMSVANVGADFRGVAEGALRSLRVPVSDKCGVLTSLSGPLSRGFGATVPRRPGMGARPSEPMPIRRRSEAWRFPLMNSCFHKGNRHAYGSFVMHAMHL